MNRELRERLKEGVGANQDRHFGHLTQIDLLAIIALELDRIGDAVEEHIFGQVGEEHR